MESKSLNLYLITEPPHELKTINERLAIMFSSKFSFVKTQKNMWLIFNARVEGCFLYPFCAITAGVMFDIRLLCCLAFVVLSYIISSINIKLL